jgi:putative heme-binding domain-containing protein
MDIETHLKEQRLVEARPVQGDLNLPAGRIIAPGDPCRSVLLYRMTTAGRGHMPYLGGQLIDDRGVLLVRDWIASMQPEGDLPPAAIKQRNTEREVLERVCAGDLSRLDELLGSASGALDAALAVIDGSLRGNAREQVIARGSALPDPLRRDLFERFLSNSQRRKVLGPNINQESLLTLKGDPGKGRALFAAICSTCHRAGDTGVDFGPDLTRIAAKYDRAALLDHILHPAKLIEPQWELTTISLKSGDVLSGFAATQTAQSTTLKLAGGTRREVTAAEVASSTKAKVSLMPEGLLQSLTAEEAADLLAFVGNLR